MPFFEGATNTIVSDCKLNDSTTNFIYHSDHKALRRVEHDAPHDSTVRQAMRIRSCDPGTQESVLKEILEWIDGDHSTSRVLWLSGPVGVGKSTVQVAQTVAERCSVDNRLAASFFFPYAGTGRYWFGNLFPTLAAQMISNIPGFKESFSEITNSSTFSAPAEGQINKQAEMLISTPLHLIQLSIPIVIVIDDLDQCEAHPDNSPKDRNTLQPIRKTTRTFSSTFSTFKRQKSAKRGKKCKKCESLLDFHKLCHFTLKRHFSLSEVMKVKKDTDKVT